MKRFMDSESSLAYESNSSVAVSFNGLEHLQRRVLRTPLTSVLFGYVWRPKTAGLVESTHYDRPEETVQRV